MKNMILGLSILSMISAGLIQPAMAADAGQILKQTILLPVRAVGAVTGVAVGTPIAVIRKSTENIDSLTNEIAPNNHIIPKVMAAGLVGIPLGLTVGTSEGVFSGSFKGLAYGSTEPFSPASFSLAH